MKNTAALASRYYRELLVAAQQKYKLYLQQAVHRLLYISIWDTDSTTSIFSVLATGEFSIWRLELRAADYRDPVSAAAEHRRHALSASADQASQGGGGKISAVQRYK